MLKPTIKLMLTIVPSRPRPRTNAPPVHQTTSVLPRECLTLAPPLAPFTSPSTFVHADCNDYCLARPPKHDNSIADKPLSVRHSIARSELLLAFAFLPPSGRFRSNSAINAAFAFTKSASCAVLLRTCPTAPLHSITLHYITLHNTPQHSNYNCTTTLLYTTLHYTTLHYLPLLYTPLHFTTLHYTTLHYLPPHFITLHNPTLQYTTPLHSTTLQSTTLRYITLHYSPQHYNCNYTTTLHYTPLHSTTLHYTPLH